MKGIILAGGSGTRLHPVTQAVSKQLLPIYDKPMIYYPLSTLMLAGIRDILVISTPQDTPRFEQLLGDGSQWGINQLRGAAQPGRPGPGLHHRRDFVGDDPRRWCWATTSSTATTSPILQAPAGAAQRPGATVFAYHVHRPRTLRRGRVRRRGRAISIEEKPGAPKSATPSPACTSTTTRWSTSPAT
jgi:glucose-1-phosphate thymidylyltransferase